MSARLQLCLGVDTQQLLRYMFDWILRKLDLASEEMTVEH